jgi:2-C-methyl-D-erythritol 4-phosphate cytidylyltransferase/2-C-methyl-D-erythritol 2,4-cyclodiphosphate synthase
MSDLAPIALILAAGQGNRFGGDSPKQIVDLCGRPVFSYALHQHAVAGHRLVVVVSESTRGPITELIMSELPDAGIVIATGGETRRESILAAIDAIASDADPTTPVLLRNAASPNIEAQLIDDVVRGLETHDGMQAWVPSNATAFRHNQGELDHLYDNSTMGFTVDPTGYRYDVLVEIGRAMAADSSGDTSLDVARALGARIGLVRSPTTNVKLTTPGDLERLASLMAVPPTS